VTLPDTLGELIRARGANIDSKSLFPYYPLVPKGPAENAEFREWLRAVGDADAAARDLRGEASGGVGGASAPVVVEDEEVFALAQVGGAHGQHAEQCQEAQPPDPAPLPRRRLLT